MQSDGQLKIESTKEVIKKDEVGTSVYELLTEHAELTFEQQALVSRLIPHAKEDKWRDAM